LIGICMNQPKENTLQDESPEIEVEATVPDSAETLEETATAPELNELDAARLSQEEALVEAVKHREEALRVRAEMENLRKRNARDMDKARKFALERIMGDLLNVTDSLERGMQAADGEQLSVEQLIEGTSLTLKSLQQVLSKHGLVEIDPLGEKFDPEQHEALSMVPTNEHKPETVVTVVQKGYLLNERLLRPARVLVARQA
jgi:molecular chaperone GrpE